MGQTEDRRAKTRQDLLNRLDEAIQRLKESLDAGHANEARNYGIVTGILVDKIQLLGGEATQILKGLEEARAQLPGLLQRLARSAQSSVEEN